MELLKCYEEEHEEETAREATNTKTITKTCVPSAREALACLDKGLEKRSQGAQGEGEGEGEGKGTFRSFKRQRLFPHVEGNYPTHVYLSASLSHSSVGVGDGDACGETLTGLSSEITRGFGVHVFPVGVGVGVGTNDTDTRPSPSAPSTAATKTTSDSCKWPLEWHVSLSRSVVVRAGQIDTLVGLLSKHLRKLKVKPFPFHCTLGDLCVLVNDDNTTCFLVMMVDKGKEHVDKLVDGCDKVFRKHGLQEYYKERKHHVSLMWAPGEERHMLEKAANEYNNSKYAKQLRAMSVLSYSCRVKIGKQVTSLLQ